jgi:hypothetical protein
MRCFLVPKLAENGKIGSQISEISNAEIQRNLREVLDYRKKLIFDLVQETSFMNQDRRKTELSRNLSRLPSYWNNCKICYEFT